MGSDANGKIVVPVWSDDGVVKPVIDDNGRITVSLGESTITIDINLKSSDITLDVEEQTPLTSIQAQGYTYVAGAWHKQPFLRGYTTIARSYMIATATGAGWVRAVSGAVPAGYIRVIEGFTMKHSDAAVKHMVAGVWNTTTYCGTIAYQACTPNVFYGESIDLTLREGEKFFISAEVSAAGKTVAGYFVARQTQMAV